MTRALAFAAAVLAVSSPAWARRFHVEHSYTVKAPGAPGAQVFLPLPPDEPWQRAMGLTIDGAPFEIVHDERYGNTAARLSVPPGGLTVTVRYDIERMERGADLEGATGRAAPNGYRTWLQPDALVPINDRIRKLAATVTVGKTTPLDKARAIWEHVLSTMKYEKKGEGWGRGDILWACDMKYGNCTDFHALFIGLLRASGVPARFHIGYSVPPGPTAELMGYHCWADFYLDGVGWVPVDASEAWKHPEKRAWFFGHHDADRFTLSTGRDVLFPGMRGSALNYFVFPWAEDTTGKPLDVQRSSRVTEMK